MGPVGTRDDPRPAARAAGLLLVDAANVIGSRPDGWWRDRAGAARVLVDRLRQAVRNGALDAPVVVVLEGAGRAGAGELEWGGVRVVHAASTGDDALVELATGEEGSVTLVSADRALAARISGARVRGPSWLLGRLGAASE